MGKDSKTPKFVDVPLDTSNTTIKPTETTRLIPKSEKSFIDSLMEILGLNTEDLTDIKNKSSESPELKQIFDTPFQHFRDDQTGGLKKLFSDESNITGIIDDESFSESETDDLNKIWNSLKTVGNKTKKATIDKLTFNKIFEDIIPKDEPDTSGFESDAELIEKQKQQPPLEDVGPSQGDEGSTTRDKVTAAALGTGAVGAAAATVAAISAGKDNETVNTLSGALNSAKVYRTLKKQLIML